MYGGVAFFILTALHPPNNTTHHHHQGGERHRVKYHTDTEFMICCDGKFDVTWDE